MIFRNRQDAGRRLASRLKAYANREDVIVLGVPRGGVPVAFEVASALNLPLDVFVLRKLGVPGHEELAFGAIGSGGVRVLDQELVEVLGLSDLVIGTRARGKKPQSSLAGNKSIAASEPRWIYAARQQFLSTTA